MNNSKKIKYHCTYCGRRWDISREDHDEPEKLEAKRKCTCGHGLGIKN